MNLPVRPFLAILGGLAAAAVPAAASDQLQIFQSQAAPGMCLSMEVGAVAIRACDDGATQGFRLSPTFKGDGMQLIIGRSGLMMGAANQVLSSKFLGGSEQSTAFTLASDGTISSGGLCVDVKGGSRRAGTPVVAFPCNGQANQRWTRADSARSIQDAQASARARSEGKLSANHAPGMCLAPDDSAQLVIKRCADAPTFALIAGGVLTSISQTDDNACLTSPGRSGQPITQTRCDVDDVSAQWGLSGTGLLRSSDGLCADVKGGGRAAGTPVIAFACSGNPNQRFALIQ